MLHGDCHPKNGLLAGDRMALIDLDQAGLGPAGRRPGQRARPAASSDRSSRPRPRPPCWLRYAEVRPLPPAADLAWHTAAAMVAERAIRAVNRVHLDAVDTLSATLDDAALVLAGRSLLMTALLFCCQHSLGLGHLARSLRLAAGLAGVVRRRAAQRRPVPARHAVPAGVGSSTCRRSATTRPSG